MVVRPETIRVRLKKLDEMIARLERIRARGAEEYYDDAMLQLATERALQIATQCVLDIGNHIIAETSLPLPEDNDEIISTLVQANILSPELGKKLKGLGGFRNALVHDYVTLDHEHIFREHLGRLDDLRDFAAEVVAFVDRLEKGSAS